MTKRVRLDPSTVSFGQVPENQSVLAQATEAMLSLAKSRGAAMQLIGRFNEIRKTGYKFGSDASIPEGTRFPFHRAREKATVAILDRLIRETVSTKRALPLLGGTFDELAAKLQKFVRQELGRVGSLEERLAKLDQLLRSAAAADRRGSEERTGELLTQWKQVAGGSIIDDINAGRFPKMQRGA